MLEVQTVQVFEVRHSVEAMTAPCAGHDVWSSQRYKTTRTSRPCFNILATGEGRP